MSTTETAFVLVPGSFSPASFYHKVTDILKSKGYNGVYETELMSAGERKEGPATLIDDAEHIRATIIKLADQGKDVVLAMNSYAGFPGSEAAKGVGKPERQAAGKSGGLIALVYIASFLPPVGATLKTMMGADLNDSVREETVSLATTTALPLGHEPPAKRIQGRWSL